MFIQHIFGTPLLVGTSTDTDIRTKICNLAYDFRKTANDASLVSDKWNTGGKSSNPDDFDKFGITSFTSGSLTDRPEWQEVCGFIYNFAEEMVRSVNNNADQMILLNMWTTIYPPGAFVPEHIHSNSLLSGVFYAKAAPDCGDTVFGDPAYVAKTMSIYKMRQFPTVDTQYAVPAEEGKMVIFPAWLPHQSKPNLSGEDRIIVSFNIGLQEYDNTQRPNT
jgi:hypothetical protein